MKQGTNYSTFFYGFPRQITLQTILDVKDVSFFQNLVGKQAPKNKI